MCPEEREGSGIAAFPPLGERGNGPSVVGRLCANPILVLSGWRTARKGAVGGASMQTGCPDSHPVRYHCYHFHCSTASLFSICMHVFHEILMDVERSWNNGNNGNIGYTGVPRSASRRPLYGVASPKAGVCMTPHADAGRPARLSDGLQASGHKPSQWNRSPPPAGLPSGTQQFRSVGHPLWIMAHPHRRRGRGAPDCTVCEKTLQFITNERRGGAH